MIYKAQVLHGTKEGRTIGFPTVNLAPDTIPPDTKQGVYSSKVKYKNVSYVGALYYGPRLIKNETNVVLEIFILDFDEEIYGESVEFEVGSFIRGPLNFSSFEEMKKQLDNDIEMVKLKIDP